MSTVRDRSPVAAVRELLAAALRAAARALEPERRPPVDAYADRPFDDEPLTDEDRAAIAESEADIRAGRTIEHAELWAELDRER
jgi:hypothetical protein